MTKLREPMTYEAALTEVAARIGWDNVAAICGVKQRAARFWSDPDCQTHIRMIDAERLDRAFLGAGGAFAPFHRMLALRLEIPARAGPGADLAACAMAAAKEAGEAIAAMVAAAAHPDDPRLLRDAARETQEAVLAMNDELAALGARQSGAGG